MEKERESDRVKQRSKPESIAQDGSSSAVDVVENQTDAAATPGGVVAPARPEIVPSEKKGLFASRKETLDKRRPPFSEQAADAWADRVAEFEFDLGELAMLEAAREGDNFVSDHHVQRAAGFLITRSKDRTAQTLKDIGGVTMGTGAGALLAFAASGIGGVYLAVSIVLTIVGTGMFFRHTK
jgi:hypothetical protein